MKENTFKLPIYCIQPSKFFLDKDKVEYLENHYDLETVCLPVDIIGDEYVLLDGHHILRAMINADYKMVSVYMEKSNQITNDLVYICKENNVSKISSIPLLSSDEYDKFYEEFNKSFNI